MNETDTINLASDDIDEGFNFTERLARYYSDFLATDFKKGRLPKRRFQTRDRKGRRAGISLEKFASFIPILNKKLAQDFGNGLEFEIKKERHTAQLPAVVRAAIEAEIKKINFEELVARNNKSVESFKLSIENKDVDLELESQRFIRALEQNVGVVISAELENKLQPVIEKSAANLLDALNSVDEDIAELIVSSMEETLPTVLYALISENDDAPLQQSLLETFNPEKIREELQVYFSEFSVGDLASELRDLSNVEQLEDNLEFYLYLGEIRYKNSEFPLFYIPFKLAFEGSTAKLILEPRLLIHKKAIDYIARIIQEETKTQLPSPIEERIIYLNPSDQVSEKLNEIIEPILRSFQFEGLLSIGGKKARLKNLEVSLTNASNIALFDKADESMLTDYEELLTKLGSGSGNLLSYVNSLIDNFMTENPTSITSEIHDDWDNEEIADRLVVDTPIPLAEEQRKIVSALNNPNARFVTVEGPPGTGKSHTISAIAFGAILNGQSILVLSDKKEALDVVENKLNETLARVRPSDDFVNPILRLGRVGTNFKKIVSNKSIENLRVQQREIKKNEIGREKAYTSVVKELKSKIREKTNQASNINLQRILEYERSADDFRNQWQAEYENFIDIFDSDGEEFEEEISNIGLLNELRSKTLNLDLRVIELAKKFGDDAFSLGNAIKFIISVHKNAKNSRIFIDAPKIDVSKLTALESKISEVKNAKGMFGYLFSGGKLSLIKKSVTELIGFKINSNKGDEIINEINSIFRRTREFYETISADFDDAIELINEALEIKTGENFETGISEQLFALQAKVDKNEIPFLDLEEPLIDILTEEYNGEAEFFSQFIQLRNNKLEIREQFILPKYDFLKIKDNLESYNALKLANQIDERVIHFADHYKNDAKTLAKIISEKKRFPRDKFDNLKQAFPCMICSLRDYAEYIPLERELFDIIIIDEASQVSIAQAFPAIIRAKKMLVLGDRKQFGNVKTSNASKETNSAYFTKVKSALAKERGNITSDLEIRCEKLNISNSILDFMENLSNFDIMLKKHFRGYPEMISFSSKYFYDYALQAMKIRGKPIDEVLEFVELQHDGKLDIYKNTNQQEAEFILIRILDQLEKNDLRSVAVITPFTDQQTLISKIFSEHEKYEEILTKLKFRSFTFDSCQGEERDIIYYSFVANPEKDRLSHVIPKHIEKQDEEELDRSKKLQRMNVAFSRGKEKLIFIHSKPISELSAGSDVLFHYRSEIQKAKTAPTSKDVDPNSEAEKKVLNWIQQTAVYLRYKPEIQPQFEIGKYLSALDKNYSHPLYRVDFMLRFDIEGHQRSIIIEYDGFEFHFKEKSQVDGGNWRHFLKEDDIEREHILESYGYKTIRLNKFNVGADPVDTIDELIEEVLESFDSGGNELIKQVLEDTENATEGLALGTYKVCKKCNSNKPLSNFEKPHTSSGYGRYCNSCVTPTTKKKRKGTKKRSQSKLNKRCPNCKKNFPLDEFLDRSTASGKRRLCSSCKATSERKRQEQTQRYMRAIGKW